MKVTALEQATYERAHAEGDRAKLLEAARRFLLQKVGLAPEQPYAPPSAGYFCSKEGIEPDLDFLPAADLERIAEDLIDEYAELEHLADAKIVFLWKREGGKHLDQPKLGCCTKASGMVKHFAQADWVIWLAADHLMWAYFTRRQVEAALYHELLHAGEKTDEKGETRPSVEGHDAEMFCKEIERYGLWRQDLQLASRAFAGAQLPLFEREA